MARRSLVTLIACCATLGWQGCEPYDPPAPAESGVFDSCCDGAGSCVPAGLVDATLSERLAQDSCAIGLLCAPTALALAEDAPLTPCRATGDLEGRCLPSCLPEISVRAEQLEQDNCAPGSLCLPCHDPRTGKATGACSIGRDSPREPPKQFAGCCEGNGRCVPQQNVPVGDRKRLSADGCAARELCAPSAWLEDERPAPKACRALGGREGRCLSSCLPEVAAQASRLPRAGCEEPQLCLPCFDPLTSEDTGVCRIAPDPGPREPPRPFGDCCEGEGRCVPPDVIADDERARLAADSCKEAGALCVPREWLSEPRHAPASCRAPGDLEGRCFPSCLPEVSARAKQLSQADCAAHQLCLPCFDPLTGKDTEACRLPGDPGPVDAPRQFDVCCGEIGRCLPRSAIEAKAQESLGRDECYAAFDALCVPSAWIEGQAPERCMASGELEGRCLPNCLPQVATQGDKVERADCPAQYACVPCFDPLSGAATGACQLAGDPGPSGPAREFPVCCDELGRCVPSDTIEAQDRARLGRDSCQTSFDALCVPSAWIDGQTPLHCRAAGDLEGRCLPSCLPQVAELGDKVQRADCPARHACVPCYDPFSAEPTGVCLLPGDSGPREPPRVFERCCSAGNRTLGTCLPRSLLPPGQTVPAAAQALCAAGSSCVPDALVRTPEIGLRACTTSLLGTRGACVPECLLGDSAALLTSGGCPDAHRCAPCTQLGLETPACD